MDGMHKAPQATADIKAVPEDFEVAEFMDVECTGEGEHIWLNIKKVKMHTDQVAKSLARLAEVHPKDVGISGMKDFLASTSQWFSVWLPGVRDEDLPDWYSLQSDSVQILSIKRHSRKLKRGTHQGNRFKILLRNLDGNKQVIEQKLQLLKDVGVPNYFGEQRFGRGGSNLYQALEIMRSGRKIKQRQKRAMLLSSARSWLFNCILSERLKTNTWLEAQPGEPLNLNGSRQIFIAEDLEEAHTRIKQLDVHTTAPLWGKGKNNMMEQARDLCMFEDRVLSEFDVFRSGLEQAGMEYSRRAMRYIPQRLMWEFVEGSSDDLTLTFDLGRGQFATSLLRELVRSNEKNVT
ncbi:MAG: tRNA pseudouridine(13) synthase TruD [Arenicella sp.]